VRDILGEPPQPVCRGRCPSKIENRLVKVVQLIDDAMTASNTGKCRRQLGAAKRVASALQRHVGRLATRGRMVPPDRAERLDTAARKLAMGAETLKNSSFCARR